MCGIAGYIGTGDQSTLERMHTVLAHRGPDDRGVWQHKNAGLAFARLAIIDLSPLGHQPMRNAQGTIAMVFNGEIYNYKELREELSAQGVHFKSTSDSEVILQLYEKIGSGCFERLKGMFAIGIYDTQKETLFLARDAMGEKPLYYGQFPDTFVFGSELKALFAHPRVTKEIDPTSVSSYLAREYTPAPDTMFAGIKKLLPGHVLELKDEAYTTKPFWKYCESEISLSDDEALAAFDAHMSRSVGQQLVADVPLGVFLSGGLDSSTIAYYAHKKIGSDLNTFSIGFSEKEFDESTDARLVAQHLGTKHHEEILSADAALELVSSIPEVFDEPIGDASVLPTMLLSQFASKQVKVALGGDGADELLLGYPTFQAEKYARLWHHIPAPLRTLGKSIVDRLPTSHGYFSFEFKARSFINGYSEDMFQRHLNWLGSFQDADRASLLTPAYREQSKDISEKLIQHITSECSSLSGLNALSHFYARTYMVDDILAKVDRASMHYSLEVRAPFLDRDLASFLLSLTAHLKYRDSKGKWLLRTLMNDRLPSSILTKKKRGFGPPVAQWLNGPLKPLMLDLLSSERITRDGYFESTEVERLMREHLEGIRDNRKQLWTLIVFQLWHDRWMRAI